MNRIKNNLHWLYLLILVLIMILFLVEIFHPTPNQIDIFETILINAITGAFVSLCICVFDYKNESERQDTIFINNIRDYYLWLQSFKDNLNEIKDNKNYLKVYDEYYFRINAYNSLIREKNDISFYAKYLDLLDTHNITDAKVFFALDYIGKTNRQNIKNAKTLIDETLDSICDEQNKINTLMYNMKTCKFKKEWEFYMKWYSWEVKNNE